MQQASQSDGPYVITLCPLASPLSIRQPQSPALKQFTFFVGPAHQSADASQLALHMGYFETLAQAQPWLQRVRARYPNAIATPAPAPSAGPTAAPDLTDTQVMQDLESRGVRTPQSDADEALARIPLLRPEETGERRILKEAVASRAPVQFAVQLDWSLEPIDPTRVRSRGIFNGLSVYVTTSHRDGGPRYFLRVGFFADPVAAKQMALRARATYTAAVVTPVTDEEFTRAQEPFTRAAFRAAAAANQPPRGADRIESKPTESLEQALESLAEHERLSNLDSTGESGVRHIRVNMEQRKQRRH